MAKLCAVCDEQVVHDERKWRICLDCLIDLLVRVGLLETVMTSKMKDERFIKMMKQKGLCHRCGSDLDGELIDASVEHSFGLCNKCMKEKGLIV